MSKSPIRLSVLALPFLFIGTLQLAGCSAGQLPPPNPGGAYRSASGGGSFDQSVNLVDETGEVTGYIADLQLQNIHRPTHRPSRVYITAASGGVVISDNDGATWRTLPQPLKSVTAVVELASGVILASGTNEDNEGIVVRSLDEAQSWEKVLTIPAAAPGKAPFFQIVKPPQPPPIFVSALVANPFEADEVYATTSTGDVLIGEQSGKTWRTLLRIKAKRSDPLTGFANAPVKKIIPSPHNPSELMLITTSGNLIRAVSGEPETITTPRVTIVDVAYINQFPNALIIGTKQGGIISRDRGENWEDLELPISKTTPVKNSIVRLSPTNATRFLVSVDSIIYRSEDGGKTWHTLSLGLPAHIITDISINPENAANVLLVTTPVKT